MGDFRIISNRDPKTGEFIASADYWKPDKVEELLKKYNPKGKLWYKEKTAADEKPVEK